MQKPTADVAPRNPWVLVRRVRQLVTLQGPSGPRRGLAMGDIQLVTDGALLVHDGVVREAGPARRIENLAEARKALEIDAGGRLVMPAFVEPDTALVTGGSENSRNNSPEAIATTSKKRLETQTKRTVDDWVRHGVLAVGSSTQHAENLRDARKLLNVQKTFQARPLRIRAVFAPRQNDWSEIGPEAAVKVWAKAIAGKRLAGVLELNISSDVFSVLERIGRKAVPEGFILRMRSTEPLTPAAQRLICDTGAISVIAPGLGGIPDPEFERASCVWVLTAAELAASSYLEGMPRRLVDEGWALALGSGYSGTGPGGYNPQYLLYLACTRLGLSIEEAITATTWNAACSLRMSTVAGSLEHGKPADLAIIDVKDYRELAQRPGHNDVHMVLRGGKPIYRRGSVLAA